MTFKHRSLTSPRAPRGTVRRELRSLAPYVTYLRNYITGVCTNGPVYYLMGPMLKRRGRKLPGARGIGGICIVNKNMTNVYTTFATGEHKRSMALFRTASGLNNGVELTTCPPKGNSVANVVEDCVMGYRGTKIGVGVGAGMATRVLGRSAPSTIVLTAKTRALMLPFVGNVRGPSVICNISYLRKAHSVKRGILIINNNVMNTRATSFLTRRKRRMTVVRVESTVKPSIVRRREVFLVRTFRGCNVGRVADTTMSRVFSSNMDCGGTTSGSSRAVCRTEKFSAIVLSVKFDSHCARHSKRGMICSFTRRLGSVMPRIRVMNSTMETHHTLSTAGRTCRITLGLWVGLCRRS